VYGVGFRDSRLVFEFRVQGLVRVAMLRVTIYGVGFRVYRVELKVLEFEVSDLGFMV
jgi:predicted membrane protein